MTQPGIPIATAIAPDDEVFWSGIRAEYAPSPDRINLENGYFGMPANPVRAALRHYQDMVDADNAYFLRVRWSDALARVRRVLAAFVGVGADELLVTRSAVAGAGRRRGVGTALIDAASAYASALGAVALTLSTAKDKLGAQALYGSTGWAREEIFIRYKRPLGG